MSQGIKVEKQGCHYPGALNKTEALQLLDVTCPAFQQWDTQNLGYLQVCYGRIRKQTRVPVEIL